MQIDMFELLEEPPIKIKIFADTASLKDIVESSKNTNIKGWTTNPTLMKQAGVTDYKRFAKDVIEHLSENRPDTCLSLEVFADDEKEMYRQALEVASWSKNDYKVYVKIPVMNSKGRDNYELMSRLQDEGVLVNATAVFTNIQIQNCLDYLDVYKCKSIISVFAGRIADTGVDPCKIIANNIANRNLDISYRSEFLWASTREVYNVKQAIACGADIITMTPDLIKKIELFNKDLNKYSLETCQMFYNDSISSGFKI